MSTVYGEHGITAIRNERLNQLEQYDKAHDALHTSMDLSYQATRIMQYIEGGGGEDDWGIVAKMETLEAEGRITEDEVTVRLLIIAGALIAAELDRLHAIPEPMGG